jgi:phage baseplate assembly protein W
MKEPGKFFASPFAIDPQGRAAVANTDEHVHDLVEAVLFTRPGERVNLPDFGCGLRQLLFAPNGELLASATEALAASALNRWLADWIIVEKLEVEAVDSRLYVRLTYTRRDTREPGRVEFVQS